MDLNLFWIRNLMFFDTYVFTRFSYFYSLKNIAQKTSYDFFHKSFLWHTSVCTHKAGLEWILEDNWPLNQLLKLKNQGFLSFKSTNSENSSIFIYIFCFCITFLSNMFQSFERMRLEEFLQRKVRSASSSRSMGCIVCVQCFRMVDSVPIRHTISIL